MRTIEELKTVPPAQMEPGELRRFAAFAAEKLGFDDLARIWKAGQDADPLEFFENLFGIRR